MNAENIRKGVGAGADQAANIAKGVGKDSGMAMPFEDFKRMAQNYVAIKNVVYEGGFLKKALTPRQVNLHEEMVDIESRVPKHHKALFDKMVKELESNG